MTRIAAVLTVLAITIAAGCGGDDGGGRLSVEEYVERMNELEDDLYETTRQLEEGFDEEFSEFELGEDGDEVSEEQRDAIARVFTAASEALDDFGDDLGGINPPVEADAIHAEFLDVTRDFAERLAESAEDAERLDDGDDAFTLLFSLAAIGGDWAEACDAIQQFADEAGESLEMDCEGDG
jgi:hypothetical protein